jgi:hypothetical protein
MRRGAFARVAISRRRWRVLDNVQFANGQFIDLQFAKPRPLDRNTIDGDTANRERAYCNRANGYGAQGKRQSARYRGGTGFNNHFAPHAHPPGNRRV